MATRPFEYRAGRSPGERLARCVVHEFRHAIELSLRDGTQVKAFREDSAQSPIRIFILSPLARVLRMGEEYRRVGIALDHLPECKLASAIVRDCAGNLLVSFQYCMHRISGAIFHEISDSEETLSINMREHSRSGRTFHGVALPTRFSRPFFNGADVLRPALLPCSF